MGFEMLEAIESAHADGNLRPLQDVIHAWYRTLLFVRDPGYDEAVNQARQISVKSEKTYSAEELSEALGV